MKPMLAVNASAVFKPFVLRGFLSHLIKASGLDLDRIGK